jgi:ketosteroid isomerase-like protein
VTAADVEAAAGRWAAVWARAWPAGDVEAVAALYADAAVLVSHPFRDAQTPRSYVEWAFASQRSAECRFGQPVVAGDRAVVEWWGAITDRDGGVETVAGASHLRFDADGRVAEQRDAWAIAPGRVEPPWWPR